MRKSLRFAILLISTVFLFLSNNQLSACFYDLPEFKYHFSQFGYNPYPKDYLVHPGYIDKVLSNLKSANLNEWKNYFNELPKIKDIEDILYNMTLVELTLIKHHSDNNSLDSVRYLKNTLINFLKNNNDNEFINYLVQIKTCEPYLHKPLNKYDKYKHKQSRHRSKEDSLFMDTKIDEFGELHSKSASPFLRDRYAHQMIRLARYSGQYSRAISIYNELMEPTESASMIKYWALEHVAGAYIHRGKSSLGTSENQDIILSAKNDIAKGNYLLSIVYDKCYSKRSSVMLGFNIESNDEWDSVVQLCNNSLEIINLYAMRAARPNGNIFEEMKAIYEIDPSSEYLIPMMIKEILGIEHDLLGVHYNNNILTSRDSTENNFPQTIQTLTQLLNFTEKCFNNVLIEDNEFWMVTRGYLHILLGDFEKTKITLQNLKDKNPKKEILYQIDVLELLVDIIQIDHLCNVIEDKLFLRAMALDHAYLSQFLITSFSKFYEKQGLIVKTFLCKNSRIPNAPFDKVPSKSSFQNIGSTAIWKLEWDFNVDLTEELLMLIQKNDKTEFEKFLISPITKDDLFNILGTIAMQESRLEDAINYWEKITNKDILRVLLKSPFEAEVIDFLRTLYRWPPLKSIDNKLTVALDLRRLLKETKDNTNNAIIYYKLGNYYLNSSYFEHAWRMNTMNRRQWFDASFMSLNIALDYYDECINLSIGKNNELAAECAFMAAKCEQYLYILDQTIQQPQIAKKRWSNYEVYIGLTRGFYGDQWYEGHKNLVFPNYDVYGKYFNILRDNFIDTDYYQEAIKECKYFRYFIDNR